MRYNDFKKIAATGNTSQVRPGSTSMNFPSPMGTQEKTQYKTPAANAKEQYMQWRQDTGRGLPVNTVQTPTGEVMARDKRKEQLVQQGQNRILSKEEIGEGWSEQDLADINKNRSNIVDAFAQDSAKRRYSEEDLKALNNPALTEDERQRILQGQYDQGYLVDQGAFRRPLAPGETYTDRAKKVISSMKDRIYKDYDPFSGGMSRKKSEQENFDIWRQENPEEFENWFGQLESAFNGANIDALTELQKIASPGENGEPSKLAMLPPEYRTRLQKAGETATWNAVKDNPLNINKAIGLWLRQNGHGGMADFVSDSIMFYGSLAALLAGGVVLGGIFGRDDDDEERYPQQQQPAMPAGYNRIPYMG